MKERRKANMDSNEKALDMKRKQCRSPKLTIDPHLQQIPE